MGRNISFLFALVALLACTHRHAAISVEIPSGYRGGVKLAICISGKPIVAKVDASGAGETSACIGKGEQVRVFATRGNAQTEIPRDRVKVETTGDGYPVQLTILPPKID